MSLLKELEAEEDEETVLNTLLHVVGVDDDRTVATRREEHILSIATGLMFLLPP